MHPENKLTNHGKTGNGGAQSQHQNVNQGPTCNLGSKGVGAGNHGAKANQISPSNSSLKNPQTGVPPFSSLKGKVKRERSVSVDSGEQREAGTPSLDSEAKGTPFPYPQDPSISYSPRLRCSGRSPLCPLLVQSSPHIILQCFCMGTFQHPPTRSFGIGAGYGATHGGATQSGQTMDSFPSCLPTRAPERDREVLWSEEQTPDPHTSQEPPYPGWWEPSGSRHWGLEE